jgi:hypothetical protein
LSIILALSIIEESGICLRGPETTIGPGRSRILIYVKGSLKAEEQMRHEYARVYKVEVH